MLVIWFALLPVGRARAADTRVVLELATDLTPEFAEHVRLAVAGQLADLALLEPAAADPLCRVWVSREGRAWVLVLATARERTVRRLDAEDEQLAAGELASIVRAHVIALLQRPASEPRVPPAKAEAAPAPSSIRATRPLGLSVSALYTGAAYAPELRWQSGLRGELTLAYAWLRLGLGYGYHPPASVQKGEIQIRVRDHALYAAAGVLRAGARFGYGGDLLAGATGTMRRTRAADSGEETGDSRYWGPALALRLRGRLRAWNALWLELLPALELTLGRPDYEIDTGMSVRILSPRALSGRVDVGATFDLL